MLLFLSGRSHLKLSISIGHEVKKKKKVIANLDSRPTQNHIIFPMTGYGLYARITALNRRGILTKPHLWFFDDFFFTESPFLRARSPQTCHTTSNANICF